MTSSLAVRLGLAGLGALAVVVAGHGLRADHRCSEVKAAAERAPLGELAGVARDAAARCGDPRERARVAAVLYGRGRRSEAIQLVRGLTRSSPDDYIGWLGVWRLTGDQRARRRAHELNPRGTPAPPGTR